MIWFLVIDLLACYLTLSGCFRFIGKPVVFLKFIIIFVMKYPWPLICADNEGIARSNIGNFFNDTKVAESLDASLIWIPIVPEGSYMNISRFPNRAWQLTCGRDGSNFSCDVKVGMLNVSISQNIKVNEYEDDSSTIFLLILL